MLVLYSLAVIVLLATVIKTYATQPRVLDLRQLTQTKATPQEAVQLTRRVVRGNGTEQNGF